MIFLEIENDWNKDIYIRRFGTVGFGNDRTYLHTYFTTTVSKVKKENKKMICPICGHSVDSDDYWYGDMCLRCALIKDSLEEGKRLPITREGCAVMLLMNLAIWGIGIALVKLLVNVFLK